MNTNTISLQRLLEVAAHDLKKTVGCCYLWPEAWSTAEVHTSYCLTLDQFDIYIGCNSAGVLEKWLLEKNIPQIGYWLDGVQTLLTELSDIENAAPVAANICKHLNKLVRKNVIVIPPSGLLPLQDLMHPPAGVTVAPE